MNIQRTEMVPKQGEQGVDTCLKKKTKNQPILNYLASTELNVKKKKTPPPPPQQLELTQRLYQHLKNMTGEKKHTKVEGKT